MTGRKFRYIIETNSIKSQGKEDHRLKEYTAGKHWKLEKRQHIMETAYRLFSEKGIIPVSITEVAEASGVGRATVFRYFSTKAELVIATGAWLWQDYIEAHNALLSPEELTKMTGAERLRFYLESFLDLYRNHPGILRFNYDFNSYLRHETESEEEKSPYLNIVKILGVQFHELYERGMRDGTLNTDISEREMFSATFHIMLAAATRYAVGLVMVFDDSDPENELVMLEKALLREFVRE